MAQAALRHIAFTLATAGLLMGCVEGGGSGTTAGGETTATISAESRSAKGRDVEAPEVFQTTDTALWDGRPSLGGIWVASPNVTDPERVVMVNLATGKTVTGALFRRERDNPGPTLQMSSDAAEALGMLAGQPAEIRITALRREEPQAPAKAKKAATATTAPEGSAPDADAAAVAADADAAAVATAATAALGVADGAGAAAPAPDSDPAATVDPAASEPTTEDPPKRKTWKERRAEAKAAREAKKAAAAGEAVGGAETTTPDGVVVDTIETAPLDARAPEATAAETATTVATETAAPEAAPKTSPKTRRQQRAEEEEAAAAAAAAEAEAGASAPAATTPAATGRPIQVASFSKEENAERAVQALSKVGIAAQARKSETSGKIVWGVVALGDAAMLKSIREAGFADAFFLK